MDIKTGGARLTPVQREIRSLVERKRVVWDTHPYPSEEGSGGRRPTGARHTAGAPPALTKRGYRAATAVSAHGYREKRQQRRRVS